MTDPRLPPPQDRQPIFNLPNVVVAIIAVLVGLHVLRTVFLGSDADIEFLLTFAFIPARISEPAIAAAFPGGEGAIAWSFVTYALLHADWSHLGFNVLWFAAFGSPLAWRFGATRFLLFSAAGAIAGAGCHLLVNVGDMTPMIGASAAISAHMAGASRFVFAAGGPLRGLQGMGEVAYRQPAAPLAAVLGDSRVLIFLGVWFGLNLVFGLMDDGGIASGAIAWQAHIGGFLAGLLLFPLFDPVARSR